MSAAQAIDISVDTGAAEPVLIEQERRRYLHTEGGNADRLYEMWGRDFRYCPDLGERGFLVWDGTRWKRDFTAMLEYARKTIRAMLREGARMAVEASKIEEQDNRDRKAAEAEALIRWARKSDTDHMVKAMLSLVRTRCRIDYAELDQHPMLLNCPNGTLDLRTGKLRAHRREDYLTQITSTPYDPKAKAPTWERFISQAMLGRPELVAFLRQYLGMALTGDISEHIWNMSVGGGRNGKSTTYEVVAGILGDYGLVMSPESITAAAQTRGGAQASPDLAELAGKRLVILTETEEGDRLAAALIKRLTGGDTIKARRLYEGMLTIKPTWHLVLYTNYKPRVRDNTNGFWDRMRLVPWDHRVRKGEADKRLPQKLQAEASGILAWLVRGCAEWQNGGELVHPAVMQREAATYRQEQDIITLFLSEECVLEDGAKVSAPALYASYATWVEEQAGEKRMSRRTFYAQMEQRGYGKKHTNTGDVFTGVRFRTNTDPDPDTTPYDPDGTDGTRAHQDAQDAQDTTGGTITPDTDAETPAEPLDAPGAEPEPIEPPTYTLEPWYDATRPDSPVSQAMAWAVEPADIPTLGGPWLDSAQLQHAFRTGGVVVRLSGGRALAPRQFTVQLRQLYLERQYGKIRALAAYLKVDPARVVPSMAEVHA